VRPTEPWLSVELATSSWLWRPEWLWRLGELLGAVSPGLAPRGVYVGPRLRRWEPRHAVAGYADMRALVELARPDTSLVLRGRTDPDQWHGTVTVAGPAAAAEQPGLLAALRVLALATSADYAHLHVLTAADLAAAPADVVRQSEHLAVTGGDGFGDSGLPYLWWGTLLGPPWTGLFDERHLAATPAAVVEPVAPGLWWLQLTGDVLDPVRAPAAVEAARQRVVDHLGPDLFGTWRAPAARIPVLPPFPADPEPAVAEWDDVYVPLRAADPGWVAACEAVFRRLLDTAPGVPRTPPTLGRPAGADVEPAVRPGAPRGPEAVIVQLATATGIGPDLLGALLADLAEAVPKLAARAVAVDGLPAVPDAASLRRALAAGGARVDCGAAELTVDLPDPEQALAHAVVGLAAGLGAEEWFAALPAVVRRWAARLRPFYGQFAVDPALSRDEDDDEDEDDTVTVDDLTAGLPNPAWGMVLGPAYADLVGADRLRAAPVAVVEEVAPGVFWLQLTADLPDPAAQPDEVAAARQALRRHLGDRLFRGGRRRQAPTRAALLGRPEPVLPEPLPPEPLPPGPLPPEPLPPEPLPPGPPPPEPG
jgi:hypothetical protein